MAFGLNQVGNPTPATATWIFRIVLYACSLGTIATATFTNLPDHVKVQVAQWSSFLVVAVHLASKMFGVPLPEGADIPAKGVESLKTDNPDIKN